MRSIIQTFDYKGIQLSDSRWKLQFDEVRDFYLCLPVDDILRGYRLRAGRPAPGKDLKGVYREHNTFGQILSGLARMYAASGDVSCRQKALALLHGWAECIEPDGFFFIERAPSLLPYCYDKHVCGLVDLIQYCGSQEARDCLSRITDWAIKNLDRTRRFASPTGPGGGEWYTLSENLYRAYLVTGDRKYREFGEVWEYTEFWKLFERKEDIFAYPTQGGWYHAYSHVNSFNGLGAAYAVKGDASYLDSLRNAYDFMHASQLWVTGGFGPNEVLMPRPDLEKMLTETTRHFETQCGSWAVFKMGKYLIRFTGDARYGDWIEQMIMNGIGASIPMSADGGVFYYSEYHLAGSAKRNLLEGWPCCSGTRIQAVADFYDLIYFHDDTDLYVNLFMPSSVHWKSGPGIVCVDQVTRFPEAKEAEFIVTFDASLNTMEFGLKVRSPGWLSGPMKATVNGGSVRVDVDSHGWAVFRRGWKSGDRLCIELPMTFQLHPLPANADFPTAITYGPVAMVVRSSENPSTKLDYACLLRLLTPIEGDPLNFRIATHEDAVLRPFYQMKQGELYFMYLDPRVAGTDEKAKRLLEG